MKNLLKNTILLIVMILSTQLYAGVISFDFKPNVLTISDAESGSATLSFFKKADDEYKARVSVKYVEIGSEQIRSLDFDLFVDKFFVIRENDSLFLFNGIDKTLLAKGTGIVRKTWTLTNGFSFESTFKRSGNLLEVTPRLDFTTPNINEK